MNINVWRISVNMIEELRFEGPAQDGNVLVSLLAATLLSQWFGLFLWCEKSNVGRIPPYVYRIGSYKILSMATCKIHRSRFFDIIWWNDAYLHIAYTLRTCHYGDNVHCLNSSRGILLSSSTSKCCCQSAPIIWKGHTGI